MVLGKPVFTRLPIALGVAMIGAGAVNATGPASVVRSFKRWGYPPGFNRVTGALEIGSGLLLLYPPTARAGALGSSAILLVATGTVLHSNEWKHLPAALTLAAVSLAVTFNAERLSRTRRW